MGPSTSYYFSPKKKTENRPFLLNIMFCLIFICLLLYLLCLKQLKIEKLYEANLRNEAAWITITTGRILYTPVERWLRLTAIDVWDKELSSLLLKENWLM